MRDYIALPRVRDKRKEYYQQNSEEMAAYNKVWNRANTAKLRATQARWRKAHPESVEKMRASGAVWRKANAENLKKSHRAWRKANPERVRIRDANRRARHNAAPGKITLGIVMALFDLQVGLCFYCDTQLGSLFHIDHYIPLTKGGSNEFNNLVLACVPCNCSKQDLLPDEFLLRLSAR